MWQSRGRLTKEGQATVLLTTLCSSSQFEQIWPVCPFWTTETFASSQRKTKRDRDRHRQKERKMGGMESFSVEPKTIHTICHSLLIHWNKNTLSIRVLSINKYHCVLRTLTARVARGWPGEDPRIRVLARVFGLPGEEEMQRIHHTCCEIPGMLTHMAGSKLISYGSKAKN